MFSLHLNLQKPEDDGRVIIKEPKEEDFDTIKIISNGAYGWVLLFVIFLFCFVCFAFCCENKLNRTKIKGK